jgi:transposase-like protein
MSRAGTDRRRIGHLFYETRVLRGREFTLKRFAAEVLDGSVDPVMLGYIEKGQRFPSEALVRRLAVVRGEDPMPLLVLLWRDRMLHGFGKELKRVLRAPGAVAGIEDAELAIVVSEAIAALPDDGTPVTLRRWRQQFRQGSDRRSQREEVDGTLAARVEALLRERGLVEVEGRKVRRKGRHYVAGTTEERQALALELCALFSKGLVEKLALADGASDTYLRNHFLHLSPERLPEFQRRLDDALRGLAEEFAEDATAETRFLNVLVTATPG